jgi:hypothetical protein
VTLVEKSHETLVEKRKREVPEAEAEAVEAVVSIPYQSGQGF